jgi:tRNA(fMet)-specific endonuclease VapC
MDAVLLDTDVFSFFFKRDSRREPYAPHMAGKQLCLAFQTIAELKFWAIKRAWQTARVAQLSQALRPYVVLPYDEIMAQK